MKKPTLCKVKQKCEDCKAYVTRYESKYGGYDFEIWEECAFKHYKQGNKNQEECYKIAMKRYEDSQ